MNPIFGQGMFQNAPNMTPQQIERKRALMAALMPRFGSAKYVGEGLGQLATGVAMGRQGRQLDQRESANRQEGDNLFQRILSGASSRQPHGNSSGFSILGQPPQPPRDPNSAGAIASDAMTAIGKKPFQGGDRESFIQAMMPHALRVSQQTGLDPRLVIAQSAQETGWGKSAPGNNFFGIKSHGKGGGNTMATNEVVNGQTVRINDSFRGYEDMGQSADDYARFLQENPRYRPMLAAGDLDGQIAALGQSGYATDPNYASSVRSIASSIQLPGGGMGEPQGQTQQTQQGGAIPLENLYSAMASPLLTDEQRSVITSMIQQRQQEADPVRQMQLQKAQIELAQMQQPQGPKGVVVGGRIVDPSTGQVIYQPEAGAAGSTEYGLQPQYGVDDQGNPVLIQIGKDGTATQTRLPEGVTFQKEPIRIDGGTEWILLDPITRQPVGSVPKQLREAASETAIGKIEGENEANAAASLSGNMAQVDEAVSLIDSVMNDPALPGITGMIQGNLPPMTQAGTDLNVKIKQLQGKAFLEAFESLKGGGAITEREGQAATEAMARLDRAQSDTAYKAALAELKAIMQKGAERARTGAGQAGAALPPASGAPATPIFTPMDFSKMTDEELDAFIAGGGQ